MNETPYSNDSWVKNSLSQFMKMIVSHFLKKNTLDFFYPKNEILYPIIQVLKRRNWKEKPFVKLKNLIKLSSRFPRKTSSMSNCLAKKSLRWQVNFDELINLKTWNNTEIAFIFKNKLIFQSLKELQVMSDITFRLVWPINSYSGPPIFLIKRI